MRRRLLLKQGRRLPSGYEELKYLQSSGKYGSKKQYIKCTTLTPSFQTDPNSVYIEMDFMVESGISPSDSSIFSNCGIANFNYNRTYIYGTGSYQNREMGITLGKKCKFIKNGTDFSVDGTSFATITQTGISPYSKGAALFGNLYEWAEYGCCPVKIYYFKAHTDTDKLELIPAIRTSDNEVGMYDIANNLFYTKSGNGTFGYEKLDGTIVQPT